MPATIHPPRTAGHSGTAARADDGADCGLRIPGKDWFTPKAAAAVIGMSESFTEKLVDEGQLAVFRHNGGEGSRYSRRIPRVSLVAYMARAGGASGECIAAALESCLVQLSAAQLLNLRRAIDGQLARINT